jgi:hypothetical protein
MKQKQKGGTSNILGGDEKLIQSKTGYHLGKRGVNVWEVLKNIKIIVNMWTEFALLSL